jgi:hypothetical protein
MMIGQRIWLGENGELSTSIPVPEQSEDRNTCIYQELGYISEEGFVFNPSQHITRYVPYQVPG